MVKIAPSILSADFATLGHDLKKAVNAGADYLHIDVMDGQFVPEITIGANVVKSLRSITDKVFDVHLMVNNPENKITAFAKAGADIITFHIEAAIHAHRLIQNIHDLGKKAGIALNPATPLAMVEELVDDADLILLMTVNPGYGGQKFIKKMTDKIHRLKDLIKEAKSQAQVEVDGGINKETARIVRDNGADILVAGSYVYGANDMAAAINSLRQ